MREINFKNHDIENLTIYNNGGFEGKIYIYSQDMVLKIFEDYLEKVMDIHIKKFKLKKLAEKNMSNDVLISPIHLVNIDGKFKGYTMPKIDDSITVNNVNDMRKLVRIYRLLFKNLEYLHENNVIAHDIKPENILVDKNKNPIIIDVDSMGVDNIPPDHMGMKSPFVRRINNIDYKMANNNQEAIDKIKLVACFVESLKRSNSLFFHPDNEYDYDFNTIINKSSLSEEFKVYLNEVIMTDDDLDQVFVDVGEKFQAEEMQEIKRRRK